jgi:predicted ribosomally synthesized peptide with nif11-like leader
MSVESAKAFVRRMGIDSAFAGKINEFDDMEGLQAYIALEGFDFTFHELTSFVGELSDDELEIVAGGMPGNGVLAFLRNFIR